MNNKPKDKVEVANICLASARDCALRNNYGRSYANFLLFAKLRPTEFHDMKDVFNEVMVKWFKDLEDQQRIEDLFKCYSQVCEVVPNSSNVYNSIGVQLFRLGYIEESASYLLQALHVSPDCTEARENFENVCSHLVERWHFRMLNDLKRNTSYRKAIENSIKQYGSKYILDVGAGSGILSLFSVYSGAKHVFACEKSKTMYKLAQDVVKANDMENSIGLILKASTDMHIPGDILTRCDLLVTETFDAALFGENIVSTLLHAWKHLLVTSPTGKVKSRVIPGRAEVYICLIECKEIRKENRLMYPGFQSVDIGGTKITCNTTVSSEEPYTTENLFKIRNGFRKLSPITKLMDVDFNNIEELERLSHGETLTCPVNVQVTGKLDAIALWFSLYLDDENIISTEPHQNNCWEQAVFPILHHHIKHNTTSQDYLCKENFLLHKDDRVTTNWKFSNDCLRIAELSIRQEGVIPESNDKNEQTLLEHQSHVIAERKEIGYLNDIHLNKKFMQALEQLKIDNHHSSDVSILDMTCGLSPLCLQAVKLGYCDVTKVIKCEEHQKLICELVEANGINPNIVSIISSEDLNDIEEDEFDVIIADLVGDSGSLSQMFLENLFNLRLNNLSNNGIILPNRFQVFGLCIQSDDLMNDSMVIDDCDLLPHKIAEYMNVFQVTNHIDIDIHTLKHKRLSEPFELIDISLNDISLLDDSQCIEQSRTLDVPVTEIGFLHAILYWVDVNVYKDINFSTSDACHHWKQAAIMMKEERTVITGEELKLDVQLRNSHLNIHVNKSEIT